MLRSLHIRNYVLIDSLDIEFPEGLVIITGQTGAGKSLLLGALGQLCGAKPDASLVGAASGNCVVEAVFDTPEGERILRRVLYDTGRSRSFVDDCPVPQQELSELGSRLLDIHSQHGSLLLSDKDFQLSLLDSFAHDGSLLEQCRGAWKALADCRRELDAARSRLEKELSGRDYAQAQYNELEAAHLEPGELESLEEEQKLLSNAEEIRERLSAALSCCAPPEGGGSSEALREARRQLEHAARFMPRMQELGERLNSVRLELDDILSEVEDALGGMDDPAGRLEAVDERLSLLYGLMRKHGCTDIDGLLALRDSYGSSVSGLEELQEQVSVLQARVEELEALYNALAASLHDSRAHASEAFGQEICSRLHALELERANFRVELLAASPSSSGKDEIRFLFAADGGPGEELSKCASGGELSRIMLSLKAMMARFSGMPTMIFDEIDTGVSGSVAARMGSMICEMGRSMQVFSVTHLPQVAAKGQAHYVVSKSTDAESGRTVSRVLPVSGEERVREIARLLSGETITPEALANARSLLSEN